MFGSAFKRYFQNDGLKRQIARMAGAVGVGLLVGSAASAQPVATPAKVAAPISDAKKAVTVALTQFKVVKDAKGAEQLVNAGSVKPGDILEYKAIYKNSGDKIVTGLVADLPIPEGLEYLPRSAKPGAALVKAATKDGVKEGVYAAEPLTRKLPNGKTESVPYSEYRALRWTLGQLPAGGEAAVTARARVEAVTPPAPKTSAAAPQPPTASVQPAASASR